MFNKVRLFWRIVLDSIHKAFSEESQEPVEWFVQPLRDIQHLNFLSIFVNKLNSLTNTDATFDIESDIDTSKLQQLIKNIEANRFDITENMLGDGDAWVFPSIDSNGELYHRYISQNDVRIIEEKDGNIVDIIGIVDKTTIKNNKTIFLCRRHTLENGVLTIETYTTDDTYNRTAFEPWANLQSAYSLRSNGGISHIGVGRFKSPVSSRGLSPVYGVPLNFNCQEIERKLVKDLDEIETEMKNNRSILFADPLILTKNKIDTNATSYVIPENLFPIDTRGGTSNAHIDIFSPQYRFDSLYQKLDHDLQDYERTIGTDKGFLTEYTVSNTATEVRRANASTISLIDKIHSAIDSGIEDTLHADCVFLNIDSESYSVKIDWFDPFSDIDSQYNRIKEAAKDGYAEDIDVTQWLFPNMTYDELEQKLQRIREQKMKNITEFNFGSQKFGEVLNDSDSEKEEENEENKKIKKKNKKNC